MISFSRWDSQCYVEIYWLRKILDIVVPLDSSLPNWIRQFEIKVPHSNNVKKADYLIDDHARNIKFLVEVKTAKTRINNAEARQQLDSYLRYSGVRFGILIDPFLVEIYDFNHGLMQLKNSFKIEDVTNIKAIAEFIKIFLDSIKMRTIAIHNSKGGVGKTTLAINIAYELSKRGNKVLVVDLDDQANASLTIGVNKANEMNNASSLTELKEIYNFLDERLEVIDFIKFVNKEGEIKDYKNCITSISNSFEVDVLPASHKTTDESLPTNPGVLKYLDKGLNKIAGDYQYVIFDTAPGKNRLTWCGLYAAQYLVIPSQMEYLSVYGIRNVIQNAREVREDTDEKRGNILGIVPVMGEKRNLNKVVEELVKNSFPKIPILPAIKRAVGVGEAIGKRIPVSLLFDQRSTTKEVAKSLEHLTDQLVKQIEKLENP